MISALKLHPLLWKLPVVALFFGTVVATASINLFPQVPLVVTLLYAAAGTAAFLAVISISIVVGSGINAYVLNKGGTDTQWLWFKADPQGVTSLRERALVKSDDTVQESEPNLRGGGV